MRLIAHLLVAGVLLLPLPAAAQDQTETLADIRQELAVLFVELQKLKRELSTTGPAPTVNPGGTVLERVDAIEAELQRLTAKTEELEFRVDKVVIDGTNRVGDLEFRVCEIEEGCDFGEIGETLPIGGGEMPRVTGPVGDSTGGAQLALGEQADFDRAREALDGGNFQQAAQQFAVFTETYSGGPLTGPAHFWRGEALSKTGDTANAARAYLESFSTAPQSDVAPNALLRLGESLHDLGQTNEACVTLAEVQNRFPNSDAAFDAGASRRALGCP